MHIQIAVPGRTVANDLKRNPHCEDAFVKEMANMRRRIGRCRHAQTHCEDTSEGADALQMHCEDALGGAVALRKRISEAKAKTHCEDELGSEDGFRRHIARLDALRTRIYDITPTSIMRGQLHIHDSNI